MWALLQSAARRLGRLRPPGLLVLYVALSLALNVAWIAVDDKTGPASDAEGHQTDVQLFSRMLELDGLEGAAMFLGTLHIVWPPGGVVALGVPASLLGDDLRTIRLLGLLWALPLVWAVYRLGREVGDQRGATLAAILALFAFGMNGHLRQVSLDYPCAAMVAIGLLSLVRTRGFSRPLSGLGFGLVVGLGLLVRLQTVFFLALPATVEAGRSLLSPPGGRGRLRQLAVLVAAPAAMLVVSALHWGPRVNELTRSMGLHVERGGLPSIEGHADILAGLAFYGHRLATAAGWPVALAAVLGGAWLAARRAPAIGVLVWSIVGGLALNALVISRETRYILAAVPPLAILAALGLARLRHGLRVWVSAVVLFATVAVPALTVYWPFPSAHPASIALFGSGSALLPARDPLEDLARSVAGEVARFARPDQTVLVVQWNPNQDLPLIPLLSHVVSRVPRHAWCVAVTPVCPLLVDKRRPQRMLLLETEPRPLRLVRRWGGGPGEAPWPLFLYEVSLAQQRSELHRLRAVE